MMEVHDGKLWTFGAERALKSPWAQGNDADLDALICSHSQRLCRIG